MAKKSHQDPSEIISAILTGDLEKVKSLWEAGSLLYRKGKNRFLTEKYSSNIILLKKRKELID